MKRNKHVANREHLFYIAMFLYTISYYLKTSCYAEFNNFSIFNNTIRITIVVILALAYIIGKHNKKEFYIFLICAAVSSAIFLKSRYFEVPFTVLMIFTGTGCNRKLLKKLLIYHSIGLSIVLVSYTFGVLPDYTYSHDGTIAHSWGFLYYSGFAYSIVTITILYFIVRHKPRAIEFFIAIALNFLFYQYNTTKLTFYIAEAYLVIHLLILIYEKNKKKAVSITKFKRVSLLIPYVCFALNMYLIYSGTTQNSFTLPRAIVNSVMSRVDYSLSAIRHYGFSLFGQKIVMVGGYSVHYGGIGEVGTNYFIDSGYLYCAIGYGILFTFLLFILYDYMLAYLCDNNNVNLFIWLIIICFASISNGLLFEVIYNPILLVIPVAIRSSIIRYRTNNRLKMKYTGD